MDDEPDYAAVGVMADMVTNLKATATPCVFLPLGLRSSPAAEMEVVARTDGSTAVALLLALVGVYGTTAYAARSKTREVGIRLALGARRRRVVGNVVTPSPGWPWGWRYSPFSSGTSR